MIDLDMTTSSSVRADNMEPYTDDQKAKARGGVLNQVSTNNNGSVPPSSPVPGSHHQNQLEPCQYINKTSPISNGNSNSNNSNGRINKEEMKDSDVVVVAHCLPELSYNYPDLVGNKQQLQNVDEPSPLCEESLKMSTADFPMIDDEEEEEDAIKSTAENGSKGENAKPDLVNQVLGSSDTSSRPPVLKSALKKAGNKKKKGFRVSFHDTKVFYIDTEAEASAEPQLLTVHSLDLPLAPTDFRVFIPAYDFLPSVHLPAAYQTSLDSRSASTSTSYSYEDAVVPLRSYAQHVNNESEEEEQQQHEQEDLEDEEEDEEFVTFNQVEKIPAETDISGDESRCVQVPAASTTTENEDEMDVKSGAVEPEVVKCLTEANLREHEMILMEQDSFCMEETLVNEVKQEESTPVSALNNEKTLSPPLKELMVDVTPVANGVPNGGSGMMMMMKNLSGNVNGKISHNNDDWQVELSPLNSIPDSETESSTSSQDTIIMMTSEESERNENHIKQSQMTFKQSGNSSKKDLLDVVSVVVGAGNENGNGSVDSQDSDETIKYDSVSNPTIRNVDIEANLLRSNGNYTSMAQKTSSQIRQLMERNAMRRKLMRYSNTRLKKAGGEVANEAPLPTPQQQQQHVEIQRQWRSHESLLDTIKKLTLEDETVKNENEDDVDDEIQNNKSKLMKSAAEADVEMVYSKPTQNGFSAYSPAMAADERRRNSNNNNNNRLVNGLSNGNLSLRDVRCLVNGRENHLDRCSSTSDIVPGDLRQWKIRSNHWQQALNNGNNNNINSNGAAAVGGGRWTSLSALQKPTTTTSAVPVLKNGEARCATLKEQYNNKDFYRLSLSHNYSQSDDHLELGSHDDYEMMMMKEEDDEVVEDEAECGDELSQFVQMDSGRIERLRKRYSYSDVDSCYNDSLKAFNRRSSVRGIKPRFGSTSEILKQLQNQLLGNGGGGHVFANHSNGNQGGESVHSSSLSRLPALKEEVYSNKSNVGVRNSNNSSIYASAVEMRQVLIGGAGVGPGPVYKQPPPYQPPPSPSKTTPLNIHTKDERGVPEGASSSPKVHSDTIRHHHQQQQHFPTAADGVQHKADGNNGIVYYVMQV